jgi:EpsI family protein
MRPAFVIAAFLWMVWTLRSQLGALPIQVYWPGLALFVVAGLMWLFGELIFVRVLTNLAAIAMIPLSVLVVLGRQWVLALLFPLSFLVFVVPFGGPLVPILVDLTAEVAFWGLNVTGLPVNREGAYFELSTGKWAVAEACSGIEYLTTCLMLGTLFAWRMFQSPTKRLAFVAASILLGVAGNWVRVYLTIGIAHITGNAWLRESHGSFGWLLFAAMMGTLGVIGWYFRDEEDISELASRAIDSISMRTVALASGIILGMLILWPIAAHFIKSQYEIQHSHIPEIAPRNGWTASANRASNWAPDLQNPREFSVQSFQKNGKRIDVAIALFHDQDWSSQLVTSVNQLANSENRNWSLASRDTATIRYRRTHQTVNTAVLMGRTGKNIVWHWYWLDGKFVASNVRAKLYQLAGQLGHSSRLSAWVAISTTDDNAGSNVAIGTLASFLEDMGDSMEASLGAVNASPR